MLDKKSWSEFRGTGLLWFINRTLHLFGWVIVCEVNKQGEVLAVYPARTNWRGFSREDEEEGYRLVSRFMKHHADQLYAQASDGEEDEHESDDAGQPV